MRERTNTPVSEQTLHPLQVTIDEAARLLCYGRRTIYKMLEQGELKSVGTGRRRRIAVTELQRWQQHNTQ